VPAALCSKCATKLPEGAQFCLRCGQPVGAMASDAAIPIVEATLGCSKCGAELPDEAQFCMKCGKPVGVPASQTAARGNSSVSKTSAAKAPGRGKRHVVLWSLLALLLISLVWAVTSENPFAQGVQEFAGLKHDEIVLDTPSDKPFSIAPHGFRYYKFSLPQGSLNVAMVGQFKASAEATGSGNHMNKGKDAGADNDIEVYVLGEAAFAVWQNGYATSSLYESGRVAEGTVNGVLPAGAGIYYLVFSNKFSPKMSKSVHASLLLRYKSWLPESIRVGMDRFWNWLGL
jgi:ribosomal protein L40E